MLKNISKLTGLFLLLLLSFIYTDKVFSEARNNDPLMKEVINYKEKNDVKPLEPTITGDEMILGLSGLEVNEKESYEKMKQEDEFDKEKIVYDNTYPKTSISNNYDYYITKGNDQKENVSIIFKVNSSKNIDELLKLVSQSKVPVNFFIDGQFLEKNVETAFSMFNLDCEIYNLGYDGKYDKSMISVTNNLIESITLKDSNLCLNENKNNSQKNICSDKKMLSITPTVVNPDIIELKRKLDKGIMVLYDLSYFDYSNFNLIVNTITSRGYEIVGLSRLIKE